VNRSITGCDRNRIQRLVDDRLPEEDRLSLEEHLSHCSSCRSLLDEAVATPQSWDEARTFLSEWSEPDPARVSTENVALYKGLLGPTDDPRMLGRIGIYEVVGILGAGGMGVVFKGCDPTLNRYVAIKMLLPMYCQNGVARQRFLREAQSAAAVIHDSVVAIHSIDEWQGIPYLVMTYIRGESLRQRLNRRGMLSVREVLRIGTQIAAGLAAAHSQGLIHRDIKTANILLETDIDRVKLTDFGLARAVDDIHLTQSGILIGTPQYMSPEQARDDHLDYRTDLFSLGSVLYEACTGRAAFQAATSYGTLRKIVEHLPPSIRQFNADMPEWLDVIIAKLMSKDRTQRYSSAAEVESLLKQCLAHVEQPLLALLPVSVSRGKTFSAWFSTRSGRLFMSIASVCLASVMGWLLMLSLGQVGPEGDDAGADQAANAQVRSRRVPEAGDSDKGEKGSTTKAGNYRITFIDAADVSRMTMSTEFDIGRLNVHQQGNSFNLSSNNGEANISGFTGGAGGGFAGSFNKPNLGLAFKITALKPDADHFVELSNTAKAVDDQGQVIESKGMGPSIQRFAEFENRVPGTQALYLFQPSRDSKSIAKLEGELLIIPGRVLSVTFEGDKPQTQKSGKESIQLELLDSKPDGIHASVIFPPPLSSKSARTPQEKFQAMVQNRGLHSAILEDDAGGLHPFVGASNAGGGVLSSVTTNSGGGVASAVTVNGNGVQGSAKSTDTTKQLFTFAPLPEGRSIKAIHVKMKDRTGEAKTVAFTLENLPLN